MTAFDIATNYARRGWSPIPVPYRSKKPVIERWQHLRLTEADLPRHFNGAPQNIGVLNGEPSGGLVDVDIDCTEALAAADAFLPKTGSCFGRKGKRRSHRLYLLDPLIRTRKFRDPMRPEDEGMLVELRSTGTQTVVPGSVHPSGEAVEWEADGEPARIDGRVLQRHVALLASASLLGRYWPGPDSHARHDFALALAGLLLRGGMTVEAAREVVGHAAHLGGDDEADDRIRAVDDTAAKVATREPTTGFPTATTIVDPKVLKTVGDWLELSRAPAVEEHASPDDLVATSPPFPGSETSSQPTALARIRQPAEQSWPPPTPFEEGERPPFPVEAYPHWQHDFVVSTAVATQTPPDYAAMLALSAVAAAGARKAVVRIRDGWEEPVNIYTLTVLPPANRTTAVNAAVTAPIVEEERALMREAELAIASAAAERRILEETAAKLEKDAARAGGDERADLTEQAAELARRLAATAIPAAPRLVIEDATAERVAQILGEQGGRIAVLSPEGDIFDILAGRYTNNGPNFGVFLKGHAGDDVRVDRVGRAGVFVRSPAITIGLRVQPGVLRGLVATPGFRDRGLLARFLYAMPLSLVGRRAINPPPVPPSVAAAYRDSLTALLRLPFGTDEHGDPAPHVLRFDGEADERMTRFEAWLEPQLADFDGIGAMTDWAGKLGGAVARIAGLLHLADYAGGSAPWSRPIGAATVERAITIGHYLLAHARIAFALFGADPVVEDAKAVIRWLEGQERVTRRDLYRASRGRFTRVTDLDPVLALLVEHEYLRPVQPDAPRGGPGRKASPVYEVNPFLRGHIGHIRHNDGPMPNSGISVHSVHEGGGRGVRGSDGVEADDAGETEV